jgi:hypothetical protein
VENLAAIWSQMVTASYELALCLGLHQVLLADLEGFLMTMDSPEQDSRAPRWRFLGLAVLILILTMAVLALLWQVPRLLPGLFEEWSEPVLDATATAVPPTATPTPAILEPTITELHAEADDLARTIDFHLEAQVPPERQVSEVLLWYDTESGHRVQRTTGPLSHTVSISHQLDVMLKGFTRTLTTTHELDYWWLVRDTAGEAVRAGGTVALGPQIASMTTLPVPEPPPVDFTWAVSETEHFQFYYVPGTAAERDRFEIGLVAEESLALIQPVLDVDLAGQMSIYLVPRIFWQGGAAYGDKVQLISYLDRNYTAVETWSYFTHEGTHALAQDILQPKENGGGPDGVLVEGLAVWASGGHYGEEPIDEWAAVVAASDEYLPLADLRNGSFYEFQHETSYLQGGSFVQYLVGRYGLDSLKVLYGQSTGDAEHDEELVQSLYGKGYADLEAEWLEYLADLEPAPEQSELWRLQVRTFDLMRRYETELDPDARLLPSTAPPEWMSDTLKVFLKRVDAPVNLVLETALIAAQERTYDGDLRGARALLDDVEAALDAGGVLTRPSLVARREILDLLAAQDRTVLRADAEGYRDSLEPASNLAGAEAIAERISPPFRAYQQELVRLDLPDDGLRARGVVLVHANLVDGDFAEDGRLFAVEFVQLGGRWLMSSRELTQPDLFPPPARAD